MVLKKLNFRFWKVNFFKTISKMGPARVIGQSFAHFLSGSFACKVFEVFKVQTNKKLTTLGLARELNLTFYLQTLAGAWEKKSLESVPLSMVWLKL